MPLLADLLHELQIITSKPVPQVQIEAVTDNSRDCAAGVLFVAIPGVTADGHHYLPDAARNGSTVALVSREDASAPPGMSLVLIEEPRRCLARLAERMAGKPSSAMSVLGITGTNGKTTTTYLLESIFRAAGLPAGVLGTINYRWDTAAGTHSVAAENTTPSPVVISNTLARMRADGVKAVAMEVSSHALDQMRVDAIQFKAVGFTNLTQDHLDYHGGMQAYQRAKGRLFAELAPVKGYSVINLDDPTGRLFATQARNRVLGYGIVNSKADLRVRRILHMPPGMIIECLYQGRPLRIKTMMPGLYNAQNCLLAAGMALAAGISAEAVCAGIERMTGAPGRFEFVRGGQTFAVVVDYAHTPDALLQVLLQARGFARRKLIAVFGCGGDRDPGKRPLMGIAAARLADYIIITNDNPRTEEPARIAAAILEGVQQAPLAGHVQWEIELDRRSAIRRAIALAGPKDAIVIAGKGHEDYQIFGKQKSHFDDREEALAALG